MYYNVYCTCVPHCVRQAVQLERYAGDIAILLAIDWFLDRCRTVVNVLGDAFGTVGALCLHDIAALLLLNVHATKDRSHQRR